MYMSKMQDLGIHVISAQSADCQAEQGPGQDGTVDFYSYAYACSSV
jgi:hypothetical protein